MTAEIWAPRDIVTFAQAAKFPAGSIVFFLPDAGKREHPAPALRFDLAGEDGDIHQWVFWLQGGPWGPDERRRTASLCRDLDARPVAGIKPSETVSIDVELGMHSTPPEEPSWNRAYGALAAGTFGLRIAAAAVDRTTSPVPIDVSTWKYDDLVLRKDVVAWYTRWRVRVWDRKDRTFLTLDYQPPLAR